MASGEVHVEDAQQQDGHAERREREEAEAIRPMADQFIVDDQIGRGGNQRHHAADQRREGHRHHQLAGCDTGPAGDAHDHRDEHGNDAGRTHNRAEKTDRQHQDGELTPRPVAAAGRQPVADTPRHAGACEGFANHEHRPDQHDIGVGET